MKRLFAPFFKSLWPNQLPKQRRSTAVVFDLEFTAWERSVARNWSRPGEKKEVVQIGAVKFGVENLKYLANSLSALMVSKIPPPRHDKRISQ